MPLSLSIVLPVHNERENVRPLHAELTRVLTELQRAYEILYVDDGSTDGSLAELEALAREDTHVCILELRRRYGQTAAIAAGMQAAKNDLIVMLDADLQNDPSDIPLLLRTLENEHLDLVHGWRRERQDAMLSRRFPSRVANWIISRVSGYPVRDVGCTLKIVRREVVEDIQIYGEMHRFIPILAFWQGARCKEITVSHRPRLHGRSKYGIRRTFGVVMDLLTVSFMTRYLRSPMKLFGAFGLLFFVVSGSFMGSAFFSKVLYGEDVTGNPFFQLSIFAFLIALQCMFLGIIGELLAKIYFAVDGRKRFAVRRIHRKTLPETAHA